MNHLYLVFVGVGLAAFLPRYLPLVLWHGRELPAWVQSGLRYVPVALLAAIVAPSILQPAGERIELSIHNAYLAGGVVALACALLSKRMLLSSFVSIAVFYAWHAYFA